MVKGLLWSGRALLVLGLLLAANAVWHSRNAPPPRDARRIDAPAGPLTYAWLDGRPGRLSTDFAGRPVLVHFWATWCAPCLRELPGLLRFASGRLPLIAVSVDDDPARLEAFFEGRQPPTVARTAMETARAFGADRLPTTVIIDAKGHRRLELVGDWDWSRPALQIQVLAAVGLPWTAAGATTTPP